MNTRHTQPKTRELKFRMTRAMKRDLHRRAASQGMSLAETVRVALRSYMTRLGH